jgi:hypothetical protein
VRIRNCPAAVSRIEHPNTTGFLTPLFSMDCFCLEELTSDNYYFTITLMIKGFKHRGLKRPYERGDRSGIRPDLLDTVERVPKKKDKNP